MAFLPFILQVPLLCDSQRLPKDQRQAPLMIRLVHTKISVMKCKTLRRSAKRYGQSITQCSDCFLDGSLACDNRRPSTVYRFSTGKRRKEGQLDFSCWCAQTIAKSILTAQSKSTLNRSGPKPKLLRNQAYDFSSDCVYNTQLNNDEIILPRPKAVAMKASPLYVKDLIDVSS